MSSCTLHEDETGKQQTMDRFLWQFRITREEFLSRTATEKDPECPPRCASHNTEGYKVARGAAGKSAQTQLSRTSKFIQRLQQT
jgi:hypothetical protein